MRSTPRSGVNSSQLGSRVPPSEPSGAAEKPGDPAVTAGLHSKPSDYPRPDLRGVSPGEEKHVAAPHSHPACCQDPGPPRMPRPGFTCPSPKALSPRPSWDTEQLEPQRPPVGPLRLPWFHITHTIWPSMTPVLGHHPSAYFSETPSLAS